MQPTSVIPSERPGQVSGAPIVHTEVEYWRRLARKDPWRDFFKSRQSLKEALVLVKKL
jgi:hypothetical protein